MRLPAQARHGVERLQGELPEREDHEDVRLARLQLRHLWLHVGRRRVVADARDEGLRPRPEPASQPGEEIAPVVVVLVEHGDLRLLDVLGLEIGGGAPIGATVRCLEDA